MISFIIMFISSFLYIIGSIVIIGGFLILPLLINGGWILYLMILIFIILIHFSKGDNSNENSRT